MADLGKFMRLGNGEMRTEFGWLGKKGTELGAIVSGIVKGKEIRLI